MGGGAGFLPGSQWRGEQACKAQFWRGFSSQGNADKVNGRARKKYDAHLPPRCVDGARRRLLSSAVAGPHAKILLVLLLVCGTKKRAISKPDKALRVVCDPLRFKLSLAALTWLRGLPNACIWHGFPRLLRLFAVAALQQLYRDAVWRAHKRHVAIAWRTVDDHALVLQSCA
jgi:hypothetical protein